MTVGTGFFGTWRDSATDTVELLTDSAEGSAKLNDIAVCALRMKHFFIGANKELKLMTFVAFVVQLQLFLMELFWRHEMALFVVVLKLFYGDDIGCALRRRVGAREGQDHVRDRLHDKGTTAFERTGVIGLP